MKLMLITLIYTLMSYVSCDLYIDTSPPYGRGDLPTAIRNVGPLGNDSTIPMHTRIYYPVGHTEYEFATQYFVGGLGGVIPSTTYDNWLSMIASHGYVVGGSWPMLGDDGRNLTYDVHMANIEWLKENLDEELGHIVRSDWDNLSLNCHSNGCGPTLEIENEDPSLVRANIHFEPVSAAFVGMDSEDMGPALIYGAGEAGRCSLDPVNHERYYQFYDCDKMLIESRDYAHCDILDPAPYAFCVDVFEFCPPGLDDDLDLYMDFSTGMVVSFINAYQQDQWHYLEDNLLDRDAIPIALSMYNTTCYYEH